MIIGLSGYAQTGKDTIADYLVSNYGFTRVAFADPIREALYKLNPKIKLGEAHRASLSHAVDNMGWEEVKKISEDTRELLQRLGTEVGRDMFGDDFWVNQAMKKASQYDKVVFTDIRYLNELQAVLGASGRLLRVVKKDVNAVNKHTSESDLDSYNFKDIISNNGTKEDLYNSIDKFMNMVNSI